MRGWAGGDPTAPGAWGWAPPAPPPRPAKPPGTPSPARPPPAAPRGRTASPRPPALARASPLDHAAALVDRMVQGAPATAAASPDRLGRGGLRPAPLHPELTNYR